MVHEAMFGLISQKDLAADESDPIGGISKDPGLYWYTEHGLYWVLAHTAQTDHEIKIVEELEKAALDAE